MPLHIISKFKRTLRRKILVATLRIALEDIYELDYLDLLIALEKVLAYITMLKEEKINDEELMTYEIEVKFYSFTRMIDYLVAYPAIKVPIHDPKYVPISVYLKRDDGTMTNAGVLLQELYYQLDVKYQYINTDFEANGKNMLRRLRSVLNDTISILLLVDNCRGK